MYLQVDHIHNIYFEDFGNSSAIPFLFLHGGPGLGFTDRDKLLFDPKKHRVIFYDQRGCSKSQPTGHLDQNTSEFLISDIVKLLNHLNLKTVHVFGGSWGATLGILFAAKHPERVTSLILRGFFSATTTTIGIYLNGEIKSTHPKSWARVISKVPLEFRSNIGQYYFDKLRSNSEDSYMLGYEWTRYGLSLSRKKITETEIEIIMSNYIDARNKIKIELHFALNQFFIPENYVFEQAKAITIPTTIIHGKYDYLCPISDAELLQSKISNSKLIVCDAGHSVSEVEIEKILKSNLSNYS